MSFSVNILKASIDYYPHEFYYLWRSASATLRSPIYLLRHCSGFVASSFQLSWMVLALGLENITRRTISNEYCSTSYNCGSSWAESLLECKRVRAFQSHRATRKALRYVYLFRCAAAFSGQLDACQRALGMHLYGHAFLTPTGGCGAPTVCSGWFCRRNNFGGQTCVWATTLWSENGHAVCSYTKETSVQRPLKS